MNRISNWQLWMRATLAAGMAAGLVACGGSDDAAPAPPPPPAAAPVIGSATIGAAGGVVDGPDGTQLVIPPGALSSDVLIRIARSRAGAPDLPAGASPSLPVYEVTPHGLLFAQPVQLKIPANPQGGTSESAWAADPGGPWSTVAARGENGFLVVERISLSWFTYPFLGIGDAFVQAADIARPFQADPASALRYERVVQEGPPAVVFNRMVLSENATLRLPLKFTALPGCTDGELEVESQFQPHLSPTLPRQAVSRQPIMLVAPAPASREALLGLWVAQHTFQTAVSSSSRGRQYYFFKYSCRYGSPVRTYSTGFTEPIYVEPVGTVAPAFTVSPVTTQVVAGLPASFTAIAQGTPAPSISWQVAPTTGAFIDVVGEPACAPTAAPANGVQTSASCRLAITPLGNNGQRYRAIASNVAAPGGVASSEAVLTITAAPVAPAITNQPANQTATVGGSAAFSVTATGTAPLTYTWRLNGTTLPASGTFSVGSCSADVTYANGGATATLSALTAGCNGVLVNVTVNNGAGSVTSNSVTVTVNGPAAAWVSQTSGVNTALVSVAAVNANTVWAVGAGGDIVRTGDAGATWSLQTSGVTRLDSISAVDANVAWAVGGEFIVKTIDGGATWSAQNGAAGEFLYSVSAVNAQVAWAVGFAGVILKTTDGGANWTTQVAATGAQENLVSVAAVDENTAWAVGNRRILKTVDGGSNWVAQVSAVTGQNHNRVVAADANVAWVVAEPTLLRTGDGGSTWSDVGFPGGGLLRSLRLSPVSATTVWALGSTFAESIVYRSTNSGITGSWTAEILPGRGWLYGLSAVDGTTAWVVGDGGRILKR
jgi:photosystem II stability/assembly factor-like uncharacterized protein